MDVLTVPKAPIVSLGGKWTTPATFSEKVPGPGNYSLTGGIGQTNPHLRSSQRSSFGKEMRKAMGSATDTPGPGQYHLGSQLGRQRLSTRPSSPASSLGGRMAVSFKQADVMGPGVCCEDSFLKPSSSPNKNWAPQYTFGLKTPIATDDGTEVPGPGAHLTAAIVRKDPTKPLAPSFSLSGRHNLHGNSADVVGPGRCRTDSSLGMQKVSTQKNYPAFSFGRRTQVKSNADRYPSPGPGAYG